MSIPIASRDFSSALQKWNDRKDGKKKKTKKRESNSLSFRVSWDGRRRRQLKEIEKRTKGNPREEKKRNRISILLEVDNNSTSFCVFSRFGFQWLFSFSPPFCRHNLHKSRKNGGKANPRCLSDFFFTFPCNARSFQFSTAIGRADYLFPYVILVTSDFGT